MRVLQSIIRGEWLRLKLCSFVIHSKTTLASISISRAIRLREMHKESPSLRAHSSASTLEEIPMLWVKPLIHFPLQSRIRPPPLTLLGFPKADPSEFSLYQPSHGLVQLTWIKALVTLLSALLMQYIYSWAACIMLLYTFGLARFSLNAKSFLCSHNFHTAKGNKIC